MLHLTTLSLLLTVIGIFTSVSLIGAGQILFIIPGLYYFYRSFQNKKLHLPKSALFLILFTFAALASLIVNHQELVDAPKNYGRLKYLVFSVLNIYAFRIYMVEASDKAKKIILNFALLSLIVVGVVSIYQVMILHQDRAKTLTDTLRYGYGMCLIIPIGLFFLLSNEFAGRINKYFMTFSLLSGLVTLYLTFNRGALLALLCAFPFTVYFWNKKKGIAAFLIAGFVVAFLGGFYLFGTGQIGNRFISSHKNKSDDMRMSQWVTAYKAWQESPIIGIGYSDFINQEQALKVKYSIAHSDYKGHAHNIFLEVLSGTGIVGFILFLGWLLSWGWELFASKNANVRGFFLPFLISLFVAGQFEVILDANNFSLISIIYGLSVYFSENDHRVSL